MSEARADYPNASENNVPIPFDIALVLGNIKKSVSTTPVQDIAIPDGTEIITVYGDVSYNTYLLLGDVDIAAPSDGVYVANRVFIPALMVKNISPNTKTSFGLYAEGSGTVVIEFLRQWRGLRNSQQRSHT